MCRACYFDLSRIITYCKTQKQVRFEPVFLFGSLREGAPRSGGGECVNFRFAHYKDYRFLLPSLPLAKPPPSRREAFYLQITFKNQGFYNFVNVLAYAVKIFIHLSISKSDNF